ncbi:MAG: type 1 periplasmic binding fold superfamily protein [Saprospiraceae bacterium]|nr:type 1 periplasmic binding fold superfamily protein [Saprospiraceae bacterium]
MTNKLLFIAVAVATSLFFNSCGDDDPVIPVEEEVITTLNYTLTPASGGASITLSFQDLDGDGGNAPILNGGTLAANETYNGSMELLNESDSPAENITEEIEEEDEEHQFFFQSSGVNVSVDYNDQDENGHPVGLLSTLTTGDNSNGTLTIVLRHQPDKSATGVSDGNISNAGGESDIEVTFDLSVQ